MRRSGLLLAAVLGLSTSSCFAVADLDRFQTAPPTNFVDLRLTVRGMTSHVGEYFEYRVIDSTHTIQSKGIALPLGGPDATFFAPGAIPKQNGPFTLDFYADHDKSGGYDNTPTVINDHAWRLPLDLNAVDSTGTMTIVFDHNTSFNYLDDPTPPREYGAAATVRFSNMGGFIGKRVEVRISDPSAHRTVALYRVPSVLDAAFTATVPGMIDPGVAYSVEVYTDDKAGGSVRGFRFGAGSTDQGLDVAFDPSVAPVVTDVPAP
jgi:hypothetical protein